MIIPHANSYILQVICTTSSANGLCEGTIPLPAQWFSHSQDAASVSITAWLLNSFDVPQQIGTVTVRPRPSLSFVNDVALVLPGRPIQRTQLFDVPVYAHSSYSVATFGIRCAVSSQLGIENVMIDQNVWMSEVRPQDYQGSADVGVVAILRNPEAASEVLLTQPEMIFSLQIRVLQTASEGDVGTVNCMTVHLSNVYDVKIQPRGMVTPTPSLVFDSNVNNDPTIGEIRVAQSVPRGLFSYATQSQIINTAVISLTAVRVPLVHLVAMSSGMHINASVISCQSSSQAFQLSPTCGDVILNGSEDSGADSDLVLTQVGEFSSSLTVRVWYPINSVALESTRSTLNAVQNWLTPLPDSGGQCRQNYQQAKLSAFTDFAYSAISPTFRVSVLPLLIPQLTIGNLSVIEVSDEGMITALAPGTSTISAGPMHVVSPTTIVVTDQEVEVSSLDITVFSALNLNIPTPPYPLVSSQSASVSVDRDFASVNTSVFVAVLAVTSDGSPLQVSESDGLTFASLDPSVIEVDNESISLVGSGSGDLLQASWSSPCTGETIVVGTLSLDVSVPEPESLQVELSSSQITYSGDTATFGGIPTSASLSVVLQYPDGLIRDATTDVRTNFAILQGESLITLTVMDSQARIEPSDPTSTAYGDVVISVSFGSVPPLSINTSLSVVKFLGVDVFANPYPPYPGSEAVQKSTFFQIENTGIYQQGTLQLHALLTDGSSVSVTDSPLVFFQSFSPAVIISGNTFQASQGGVYRVQGQLGPNIATVNLTVSNTPVIISSFLRFSLSLNQNTLQGLVQFRDPLELDVLFSDNTEYPRFIPSATTLFPSLISLSSDTPSAASVSSATGNVTLLSNHHSLVTVTATKRSDNRIQSQISFACNLEPSIGDVDIGSNSGIPIPPIHSGSNFSVPLLINAGSQALASAQLAILYGFENVNLLRVSPSLSWPGTIEFSDSPSTGLLTLTASSGIGALDLVHIATLDFMATSSGVSSVGGVILQLTDLDDVAIGDGRMRQFTAGQVSFEVLSSIRKRRQTEAEDILFRIQRSTQCTSPLPCSVCPDERELGDVNGDCIFNEVDPLFLLQYHAEGLFDFELQSGMALLDDLIPAQESNLDSDLNTAADLQDAYFLLQTNAGLLNFLRSVHIRPVQESGASCSVSINATVLGRRNLIPDSQFTEIYFDIGLPFDPTFASQQLYDRLIIIRGMAQPTANKGLALQGGIIKASPLEPGIFGVEFQTNLTLSDIGVSVIQVTSVDGLSTNQARTKAMFGHPDPPFTFPNPLDITIPSFAESTSILASYGYNPFVSFNNNLSSGVCLTPPGPPIINQTLYIAQVAENTVAGVPILTFTAQSQSDLPVAFSIASGNTGDRFVIHPSTGVLSVSGSLDYEVLSFYRLQLVATDPATKFSSSSTAEISITDVNDNEPIFSQIISNISIPANTPVGSLVTLVNASDADSGTNAIIEFSIASDGDTFAIDSTLGTVTLASSLNFDLQNFYTVVITATDRGIPQMSSIVTVNITIEPPDPTLLQFDSPVYLVNVTENSPVGLPVLQVRAAPVSNETSTGSTVVYTLETPGVPFSIVRETGELTVSGDIDREAVDLFELQVSATLANTDRAIPARAVVAVDILDINDNVPDFFEDTYSAFLAEELPPNSLNLVVTANDLDLDENGTVEYSLEETYGLFMIDSGSGRLTNTQPLDYEVNQNFTLTVTASDMGTPSLSSSVDVVIFITDVNDNAPTIAIDPPSGFILVAEDIPIGSLIASVNATDLDSTMTNGAITFSLSSVDGSSSSVFGIDFLSGEIRTISLLDFEITQLYELIVTVQDSGIPRLSAQTNLTVTVTDVNDNPPLFVRDDYNLVLSEATNIGAVLLQLEASDNDTGINAELSFALESAIPATGNFNVTESGAIVLNAPLDFEAEQMHSLIVRVTNIVPGAEADFASVQISVTDFNEFSPTFSADNYSATVIEEAGPGAFVTQVIATDMDATSNITYLLNNSAFSIDAEGNIYTLENLDREVVPMYVLTVIASDNSEPARSSSATVVVVVTDINDNAPVISPFPNLTISENTSVGSVLLTFTATDLDTGINGEIGNFTLISPSSAFALTIDGQLILSDTLDAFLVPLYILTIQVEDSGTPPLSSSAELNIEVEPTPGPFFEQPGYSTIIEENNPPNTFLVQVTAVSRNPMTVIDQYILSKKSQLAFGSLFAVDSMSGNVTALVGLDREQQEEYLLTVAVQASLETMTFTASTMVSIILQDQNDNAPQFEFDNQTISIPETTEIGSIISTVVATDSDVLSNAEIVYSIIDGNSDSFFSINRGGNITTMRSLLLQIGSFNLTIQAENPLAVGGLSSVTQLQIEVIPVNDFAPQFSINEYIVNVLENITVGAIVANINATDGDLGTAGEIIYSISAGNEQNRFSINGSSGELRVLSGLDYETTPVYNLTVTATDNGTPPLFSDVPVSIQVIDINDNPPVFSQSVYRGQLLENLLAGQSITTVVVTDEDSPLNARIVLEVVTLDLSSIFSVTPTGEVQNLVPLDREAQSEYTVVIMAINEGSGVVLSESTTVVIEILDANDNAPQFLQSVYSRVLRAPVEANTTIVQVQANDVDQPGSNSKIRFSLEGAMDAFAVDPISGIITTAQELISEVNITFSVIATDLGVPPLSNQTSVMVMVLPAHDLTAGRERDIDFSTENGIYLVSDSIGAAENTYQQGYGFLVGRDIREPRSIGASLDTLTDSLSVFPTSLPAASLTAVLISSSVWHDNPTVQVAVQARDEAHSVHVQAQVTARVTHPAQGTSQQSSCTTQLTDGTCIISISLPDIWFSTQANVTVEYGLSVSSLQRLGTAELQQRPTFGIGSNIYVYMEMPLQNLFRNDFFEVTVFGEAGSKAVGSFTVSVSVASSIRLLSLSFDGSLWQAQTQTAPDGSITITAVRADQSNTPPPGRVQLFTIRAQVSPSSPVDTLVADAVLGSVVSLSDFDRMMLLPAPGVSFIRASALSRNGITASGAIFVADDHVVGLLPFTSQAEFVNTAFLDGNSISFPVTILEVRLSGSLSPGNTALCSSSDPGVIDVTSNCSSLLLTSSQNRPSNGTNILVSQGIIFASFPVQVWTPQEFMLTSGDTTLNLIPELLDPQANCSPSWQYSNVKCFANFTNSLEVVQRIDVTSIFAPLLFTTDSSILRIAGSRVHGLRSGVAQIQLTGLVGVALTFTVTEQPVQLLGVDVQVIGGLKVSGSRSVGRLGTASLTVISEQILDFEGVQAVSVASAVYSDGFRLQLSSSDITFTSLDSNIVQLSDGNTVTAVGTGQGELVQATWRPATQCGTDPIATGFGLIDVTIPLPSDIIITVPSSVLAISNSTANFIGVPTSTTVQVVAVYSDGRRQDLTTDNRTMYAIPNGISISRGAQVILVTGNSAQIGEHIIQVSFSQFPGLERNVTITVVQMSDIALRALPYPEYPGSSSNLISMLHPIAETGVRQQALILADAVLSNGDRQDISSRSELEFGITTSLSNVRSSISQNILTVPDAFRFGTVTIRATLRGVTSRSPLRLELSPVQLYIASIRINPFPEGNTFRGTIGSTRQVVISATLDDGRQYVNVFQDYNLPNFVTFAAMPASALTIGSTTGVATLQGNSLTPATITVFAIGSDGTQTLQVNSNLDPEVGDVDLGSLTGIVVPSRMVGSTFTVPVRVNSGASILDSIDLDITYDPTIIRARSASVGPDWPSTGQFQFTVDDPVDLISIGGTLVGSAPVTGSALHLVNVQFEAVGAGTVNISGVINTLAEQSTGGAPASNIGSLPREFVAGSVQMQVSGSRRRREAHSITITPHLRSRRQSASCPNPPCDICTPFREHGDVDGNCIFDVRDASFLQLYYLTTITTGTAPPIPADRQAFLDTDMNGAVDPNDVVFMLRVNFRLLRFLTNTAFISVQDSGESCLLSFNVTLLRDGATVADNSSTALIIDLAHEDPTFQQMFDDTVFTLGTPLQVNKGTGLFGGFVEAQYLGEGIYGVIAESAISQVNLGLSPILVTFDGTGASSPVRTAPLFSQNVPRYGNLDASFLLREQTIRVTTQLGYSPLITVSSPLTTEQCRLQNLPLVFENATYSVSVAENAPLSTTVLQIQATSNRPNTVITYSLNSTSSLPFTVNSATGIITLTSLLDFESTTSYEFEAVAEESTINGQFIATVPVTISVTNVNDLPPIVSPVATIQLLATASSTEEIIRITATDPDFLDPLVFSLTSSTSFAIDRDTGAITATTNLSTIANQLMQLNVSVSDGLFTVYSEVIIDVYLPSFTQELYSAVISESTPVGSMVLSVAVQDFRRESFEFAIDSAQTVFQINSSGVVILREAVDFEVESQRSFIFRITAESAVIVLQAEISITITNENDNVPVFSQSQYNLTIPSSTPVGTRLLQMEATDDDFGPTSAITYGLVFGPNVDLFSLDTTTGELFLARTLLGRPMFILLNISATDAGEPPISSYVTVEIQVTAVDVLAFPIPPSISASDSVLALSVPQRSVDSNDSFVIFEQSFGKLASPQAGLLTASYPNVSISESVGSEPSDAVSATFALLHPSTTVYHDGRQVRIAVQVRDSNFQTSTRTPTEFSVRATLFTSNEIITSPPCTPHAVYGTCVATVTLPQRWFAQVSSFVALDPLLNGRTEGVSESLILVSLQPAPTLPTSILNEVLVELPSRDIVAGESFTINVYGYSTYSVSGFSILFNFNSTLTSPTLIIDSSRWSTQTVNGVDSFGVSAILSNPDQQNTPLANPMVQLFSLRLSTSSSIATQTSSITALVQSLTNVVEGSVVLTSTNTNSGPAFFTGRGGGLVRAAGEF